MSIATYDELRDAILNHTKRDATILPDARLNEHILGAEDRIYTDLRVRAMERTDTLTLKKAISLDAGEVADTGTTVTLTPATAATGYVYGDRYTWEVETTNTGAVDVNISGQGAQDIKVIEGDVGTLNELEANDFKAGTTVEIVYDGTRFVWVPRGGIPLPARFIESRRVFIDADIGKLDYMTPEQFWARRAGSETGAPKLFTIEGGVIVFAPSPDATYEARLLYHRKFAALSADSDTNWLLTNAPMLYLYASLIETYLYLNMAPRALEFATAFDERVRKHNETANAARYPRGRTATRSEVPVA